MKDGINFRGEKPVIGRSNVMGKGSAFPTLGNEDKAGVPIDNSLSKAERGGHIGQLSASAAGPRKKYEEGQEHVDKGEQRGYRKDYQKQNNGEGIER